MEINYLRKNRGWIVLPGQPLILWLVLSSGRCGPRDSRGVFRLLHAGCPRAAMPLL